MSNSITKPNTAKTRDKATAEASGSRPNVTGDHRSPNRNGPHGETRHCTSDFVCSGNVAKFVDLISCQILEVVKFCDVHPLLHQQIFMRRIPTRASWSCR